MGHNGAKTLYGKVGKKIDSLHVRVSYNKHLYPLLEELFPEEEARLFIKMPYTFSDSARIAKIAQKRETDASRVLDEMCKRGTVIDITIRGKQYYMPCPMVIGTFEWVMMKVGEKPNTKDLARLFHNYFEGGDLIYANTKHGLDMSTSRTLAHQDAVDESQQTLILDYEKAEEIIKASEKISLGLCACRHEKDHVGDRECNSPTDTCLNLGWTADFLVRRNIARKISTTEALENIARSKELGLALTADNVKKNAMFICQCCGCCCHLLLGVSRHGCPNTIVTSNYIATVNDSECLGCGECAKACPINAIGMKAFVTDQGKKKKLAVIDRDICLGCGVCAFKMQTQLTYFKTEGQEDTLPGNNIREDPPSMCGLGNPAEPVF